MSVGSNQTASYIPDFGEYQAAIMQIKVRIWQLGGKNG